MALGAGAIGGAVLQGGMAIADLVKKLKKRKMQGPAEDPLSGAIGMANQRLGRDLSGRVNPEVARATSEAVARPHAEAIMAATRGIGPAAGSRIKTQGLMQQASALSGARAGLVKDADSRASSVADKLSARGERNLGREDQYRANLYGTESGGERAAGAVGGLLGEGANMGMLLQRLKEAGRRGGKKKKNGYGAVVGGSDPFSV